MRTLIASTSRTRLRTLTTAMATPPAPAPSPPPRVAVVGAGLAGSAAAAALAARGAAVTVYDAGFRCAGGRASARPGVADHGCQVVAPAAGGAVEAALARLEARGAAARWTDGVFGVLDAGSGSFEPGAAAPAECVVPLAPGVWVGAPSAAALAAGLLADTPAITVMQGHRVVALAAPSVGGPFAVTARPPPPRGAVDGAPPPPPPSTAQYDAVVLADASVVARPGGAASVEVGGGLAASTVVRTLAASRRAPVFTAVVTLPGAVSLPFDGAAVVGSADVAAIINDSAKPGRAPPRPATTTLVVVSTPSAGAALTAASPPSAGRPSPAAQAAAAERLWTGAVAALAAAGVTDLPPPVSLAAQRWGAGVETAVCGDTHAREGRLAGCGDLFRGDAARGRGGADAALASGLAAGEGVARELGLRG
jgi:predicted NAD/FAD-dependent oxidoreductase